jgi:hypothetical protein
MLKRSTVSSGDLLQFYNSVLRSMIDCACLSWQAISIANDQRNQLEAIV